MSNKDAGTENDLRKLIAACEEEIEQLDALMDWRPDFEDLRISLVIHKIALVALEESLKNVTVRA